MAGEQGTGAGSSATGRGDASPGGVGSGLAAGGISGGMAGTGTGGATGSGSDTLASGENLGGGGTVGSAAVSLANTAGATSEDMVQGGGLDQRNAGRVDLAGDIDHPLPDATPAEQAAGAPGVMPGAVMHGQTGSGLAGGTAPGGPLGLDAAGSEGSATARGSSTPKE
jgi:hypothetical protein